MAQTIEVIEFLDERGDTIVHRYPSVGAAEIKMGAQLIVRENQTVVFFRDGKALDTFGPGRHTLTTMNIPVLTTALSLPFGFESPFKAEAVYVNMKVFTNQKWGTMEPILYRDAELAMVRLRAFGIYAFRVTNPQVFVNTLVGTQGCFTTAEVADFFRNLILTQLADYLGENLKSILDLAQYYNELSAGVKACTLSDFEKYGVTLTDFKIGSISVPENVQELIDKRSGMAAVGNLDAFMKFQAASAMEKAVMGGGGTGDGTIGAGIGLGAGLGMGAGMAGMVTRAMAESVSGSASSSSGEPNAKCIKCGAAIVGAMKFCSECGSPQHSSKVPCPACQESVPFGDKFCSKCGSILK